MCADCGVVIIRSRFKQSLRFDGGKFGIEMGEEGMRHGNGLGGNSRAILESEPRHASARPPRTGSDTCRPGRARSNRNLAF